MAFVRPTERSGATQAPRAAAASRPGVRRRILEAALTEFAENGFQEASLAAIARRLGVTAPLVLYHFGSKANLWREALEVFCANFAAVVARAVEEGQALEGRDALRLLVRRLVYFFAIDRAACRLLRDEGGAQNAPGDWFTSQTLRPIIEQIESVYRRAVEEGAVRPAPFETTFFMIVGAASCYLESRARAASLFGGARDESAGWIEDYADQVVGLCFEGLTAPSRRSSESARPRLAALRTPARTTTITITPEAALA